MTLYIDNQQVELLDSGLGLSMTVANPAFTPDKLARTVSYTFKLPASPHNLRLLPAANRLDRKSFDFAYPATILDSTGGVLHEGELVVMQRSEREISVVFRDESPRLIQRLQTKISAIPDVVEIPQAQLPGYNLTLIEFAPTYQIRINSHLFTQPAGDRVGAGFGLASQINLFFALPIAQFDANNYVLSVWPAPLSNGLYSNIGWVDTSSFQGFNFTAPGDFYLGWQASETNFFDWLEPQYVSPRADMAWPMVAHLSFYEDTTTYYGIVNHAKDGVATKRGFEHTEHPSHPYVPYIRALWALKRVVELAGGVTLDGDFVTEPEGAQLLLFNPREMGVLSVREDSQYVTGWGVYYAERIVIGEHLPDLTGIQLLMAICEALNLRAAVRGGTVVFSRNIDMLSQIPVDWSEWIEPGYEVEDSDDQGYTIRWTRDDKEQFDSTDYGGVTVGDGVRVMELKGQPLAEQADIVDFYESPTERLRAATTRRPGSSLAFEPKTIQDIPFRFFWERGLQPNDAGKDYWQSTNGIRNYQGVIVGDTDLKLFGPSGLVATNHGAWPGLEDRPVTRASAVIPIGILHDLLKWRNPIIRYNHPMGAVKGLIKEIQYNHDDERGGRIRVSVEIIIL